MEINLGIPHSVPLVLLSVAIAIFGGFVGLRLAAQASHAVGVRGRVFSAGAAWTLGLTIWTMHFVAILAANFPSEIEFSAPLTLISFLLCVIVVGISAFLDGRVGNSLVGTFIAALFMGSGIVSMHYIGFHAIHGKFSMTHSLLANAAATIIAIAASFGTLRITDGSIHRRTLGLSAVAFGLAVAGMHYTSMSGMTFDATGTPAHAIAPLISTSTVMITIVILAFIISGSFLLFMIPDAASQQVVAVTPAFDGEGKAPIPVPEKAPISMPEKELEHSNVPIETDGAVRLLPASSICAIQATAHYTLVYDGEREYLSPWSIAEAEARLSSLGFMRVHRSHMVAIDKVQALRRSGDGGLIEAGHPTPRLIPVSRVNYAEVKSRLGLQQKLKIVPT